MFARRPLRFDELQDALWLLYNKTTGKLDSEFKPRPSTIRKLFAPLIHEDESQPDGPCRLVHSTVSTYLKKNPHVLQDMPGLKSKEDLRIGSFSIADACLKYLALDRYRKPLVRQDDIHHDSAGNSVEDQHFLQYSAKYWDRHLDTEHDSAKELSGRLHRFLNSPNFITCLQCQSLWVEGHFVVHILKDDSDGFTYRRRFLPEWFDHGPGNRYWKDYRSFIHEWSHYLECGTCETKTCPARANAGEMDRIFWGGLDPGSFLSHHEDRYQSHQIRPSGEYSLHKARRCFEGLTTSGEKVMILQLRCVRGLGHLDYVGN